MYALCCAEASSSVSSLCPRDVRPLTHHAHCKAKGSFSKGAMRRFLTQSTECDVAARQAPAGCGPSLERESASVLHAAVP
jgi:hypothetical protein